MADALSSSIATFHTKKIIITDSTKFLFVGSIPESMYRCVSPESKIITEYLKSPPTGPRPLTLEMQQSIDGADKPEKCGKKVDQK